MERPLYAIVPAAMLGCFMMVSGCSAASGDSGKGKATAAGSGSVAAKVGETTISLQDVDAKAAANLMKVRQQEYDVREQALDGMIDEELLNREAKSKGLTSEKLIETEINSKVADATPAEIDAYYEQNKARLGTQTKEQASPQIGAMLKAQKMAVQHADYVKGLRQKYGVKVMLEPPRVQVSLDDDPSKGPASAPVTIVEFSDFQCPFCGRAEASVDDVLKKYGDKVRLVYRDYPLSFHPNAENAAMASECAHEQGKYWEMHNAMFGNQAKLAVNDLVDTAGSIGMDKDKFKACLDTGKYRAEVQHDFQDGQKYGVTGTPTFFINGIMLVGAQPTEKFSEIIDRELMRAGK